MFGFEWLQEKIAEGICEPCICPTLGEHILQSMASAVNEITSLLPESTVDMPMGPVALAACATSSAVLAVAGIYFFGTRRLAATQGDSSSYIDSLDTFDDKSRQTKITDYFSKVR